MLWRESLKMKEKRKSIEFNFFLSKQKKSFEITNAIKTHFFNLKFNKIQKNFSSILLFENVMLLISIKNI